MERIIANAMKPTLINVTTFPIALAAVLLAGCKSNQQPAPQQSSEQPAQTAPAQPAQQAMNPEAAQSQQAPSARERELERKRYQEGYAAGQKQNGQNYPPQQGNAPAAQQAYAPPPQPRAPSVIPAGTHIVVTLAQTLSSKTAQPGDSFTATVADPVIVDGATLIRAGSSATGTVTDAKALGRFKGGAELAVRLDSVRAEGRAYQVASSTVERVEQGKGKRTAVMTGGGTGFGALIGGLAGGGKGALIGGLAGAGAGGAGSAFTGNKELVIPAETSLTFRLERDVPLR